jgi:hypothetical protein
MLSNGYMSAEMYRCIPLTIFHAIGGFCVYHFFLWVLAKSIHRPEDNEEEDEEEHSEESVYNQVMQDMKHIMEGMTEQDFERYTQEQARLGLSDQEMVKRSLLFFMAGMSKRMVKGEPTKDDVPANEPPTAENIEVTNVPHGVVLQNDPARCRYQKMDNLPGNYSSTTPDQVEDDTNTVASFQDLNGMEYAKAIEVAAQRGYKLHVLYVGNSGQKYPLERRDPAVLGIWLNDTEYDYYRKLPSERAVVGTVMDVGGVGACKIYRPFVDKKLDTESTSLPLADTLQPPTV